MKLHRKREIAPCSLDGAVTAALKLDQNNFLTQFILQTQNICKKTLHILLGNFFTVFMQRKLIIEDK
jgi:hypothetical protein